MNLQELQASMLRGQQAQGKVQGLEEDLNRAEGQRGAYGQNPDQWGQISDLAVVDQILTQSQGRQGVRETKPKLEKARAAMAQNTAAQEGNTLRMALDKETRNKEAHVLKQATNAGKAENWTNKAGDKLPVVYGPTNEPMLRDGSPVPEGYYKADRSYGGMGSRGKSFSENDINKLNARVSNVTNTRQLVEGWNDGFAQPSGLPTNFADAIAKNLSGNDLMKFVDEDTDANVKAAAQWWAGWRMNFTADKRHELFGATLTPGEKAAWDAAELVRPGMDPKEINKRINKLQEEAEASLLRRANMSTSSGLQGNRDLINRAVGHLYDYDPETNLYGAQSRGGVPADAADAFVGGLQGDDLAYFNSVGPEEQAEIIAAELGAQ